MSPKTGDTIWMRCEVRPGPFSNERFVKAGDWLGFVRLEALYEPIETGETWVLVRIVEVSEGTYQAKVLGEALKGSTIQGSLAEVTLRGSVQA